MNKTKICHPLRRRYLPSAIEDTPLIVLRNNSIYLTRSVLNAIGHPTHVLVTVRNGSVLVRPSSGGQGRGSGVRKLVMTRHEGGWLPEMDHIIREVMGGDITLAIDYTLPMLTEG